MSQSALQRTHFVRSCGWGLRGRWCYLIVLNVHAPTEDKIYGVKDRFYEELERVFDKFPEYHTKILLGILMPR
jgi:hypothetical protein